MKYIDEFRDGEVAKTLALFAEIGQLEASPTAL